MRGLSWLCGSCSLQDLDAQVVDNELPALRRVLAHEELKRAMHAGHGRDGHRLRRMSSA